MADALLSLTEAARRLGVHATTLRRWADNGSIRVSLTPGGHRRFLESEVEKMAGRASEAQQEASVSQATAKAAPEELETRALNSTRTHVRHHEARWLDLSDAEREEKRLLGRRLVGLMIQFVSADDGGEAVLSEARAIGRIHARAALQEGLELSETLKATLFFRDNIVESAIMLPQSLQDHPEGRARLYRRINEFLNEIQLAIADVYQAAQSTRSHS